MVDVLTEARRKFHRDLQRGQGWKADHNGPPFDVLPKSRRGPGVCSWLRVAVPGRRLGVWEEGPGRRGPQTVQLTACFAKRKVCSGSKRLRIALISRRSPPSAAAMVSRTESRLNRDRDRLIGPPYKPHRD
jgi:hypothetical protein